MEKLRQTEEPIDPKMRAFLQFLALVVLLNAGCVAIPEQEIEPDAEEGGPDMDDDQDTGNDGGNNTTDIKPEDAGDNPEDMSNAGDFDVSEPDIPEEDTVEEDVPEEDIAEEPEEPSVENLDIDEDGVPDAEDNCPEVSNGYECEGVQQCSSPTIDLNNCEVNADCQIGVCSEIFSGRCTTHEQADRDNNGIGDACQQN